MATVDDVIGSAERERDDVTRGREPRTNVVWLNGYEVKEVTGQALCEKKLHCVETVAQISSLGDDISALSQVFDLRVSQLVHTGNQPLDTQRTPENRLPGFIGQTAQDCIFGVRDNWNSIVSLFQCAEVHLRNGVAYHEFFHEVYESESWMLEDLSHILSYFETKVVNGGDDETRKLAEELGKIDLTLRQWEAKSCRLWESATRLVPVTLRTSRNREPLPARAICNYETSDVRIRKNEDIVLLDNSRPKLWKIRTGRGQEGEVPSPVILLPGQDAEAIKAALRLRLVLLSNWTNALKLIGKRLIYFMAMIFKSDYTREQISALKSMNEGEKESLLKALTFIEDAFRRFWAEHEGFTGIQERIHVLRIILQQQGDGAISNEELHKQLAILIRTLHQAATVYQNTSDEWEKFKAVLEASRSPELMLILDNWEQLQFVSKDNFPRFWKSNLDLDDEDKSLADLNRFAVNGVGFEDMVDLGRPGGMVERGHEETTRPEVTVNDEEEGGVDDGVTGGQECRALEYECRNDIEHLGVTGTGLDGGESGGGKERKTAETEQLTRAEVEEKRTFHIKSVVNPVNQAEISLQEAIALGILRPDEGVYANAVTGETVPIPVAMGDGLIKVMFSKTKRGEERTSTLGIITVRTIREERDARSPVKVIWVKDVETGAEVDRGEADRKGILDAEGEHYIDPRTGRRLPIREAVDANLVGVEESTTSGSGPTSGFRPEPEVVSTTYAVRAVVDRKRGATVTFAEAIRDGIVERDTGSYVDGVTGVKVDVAEAVARGFIKASVVDDPNTLDIDPENRIFVDTTQKIRDMILKPLEIISAFKMAGKK